MKLEIELERAKLNILLSKRIEKDAALNSAIIKQSEELDKLIVRFMVSKNTEERRAV